MTRRRVVVLASAGTLLGLFVLLVIGLVVLTRTDFGRERIRAFAVNRLKGAVHGKIYVGHIRGSLLTALEIDSLEIRGEDDSLFIATGQISLGFEPRDLLDKRIVLTRLHVSRPVVHISVDTAGTSNFRKIFPAGKPSLPSAVRGWGDYIALRQARLDSLTARVITPWEPPDSLRGARLDSAIAYNMARKDKEIRRSSEGLVKVLHWTRGTLAVDSARLDDKGPGGRRIHIGRLDVDEFDPPFEFRNVHGDVRLLSDSLWADIPHFDLPGSTGSAHGKAWWGSGKPVRYDMTVVGDSVSLADVAWVYPTLPHTGGGTMTLVMRSEKDPAVVDYVLRDMDVRSTESRLRGAMTFGVGAPVLILKDVNLQADPVDFRLIETLSGEPLPYPFRGTLTGRVRAAGGPLNRFALDSADIVFRDANVPGAVMTAKGHGGLDILKPSETVFHNFALQLGNLDLRTLQVLNPDFPHLDGLVSGHATLDSSMYDIRFRDADIVHTFADLPPSHLTGAGRVTFGDVLRYDMALDASPLSFTSFAPAYRDARLRLAGEYTGPMRLEGTLPDLYVSTELRGTAGMIAYDGRVDADSVGGYGFDGTMRAAGLDLRTLLDTALLPPTSLTGSVELRMTGDSLANLAGSASIVLERSLFDSVRVFATSRATLRFAERKLYLDTLVVETVAANLNGRGAIGLVGGTDDSLKFTIAADSLGALRRFLAAPPAVAGAALEPAVDSLLGIVAGEGTLSGSLDSLSLRAVLNATGVTAAGAAAKRIQITADFDDLTGEPRGVAGIDADALSVGGTTMTTFGATVHLANSRSGDFSVLATAANGPVISSVGALAFAGDTTRIRLDSLRIALEDHVLTLARPSTLDIEPGRLSLDTLRLDGERGERLTFAANLPDTGEVQGLFRVDSLHLSDLATLAQTRVPLGGALTAEVEFAGTRLAPRIQLQGRILGAAVGDVKIARLTVNGQYEDRRLQGGILLVQEDTVVAEGAYNIPIDIALEPRAPVLLKGDTLRVRVASRDVNLRLLESFTPQIQRATGKFTANFELAGPDSSAELNGLLTITDGAASIPQAGIRLRDVNASVRAVNDTLHVERFSLVSGDTPANRLEVSGLVARPLHRNAGFDLTMSANEFHIIGNRSLADLNISTSPPLHLTGTLDGSQLTGTVIVNSGSLYMPQTSDKQLISLSREDLQTLGLDTLAASRLQVLPNPPSILVQNLTLSNVDVAIGPDVWLRSAGSGDINIKLGGSVRVTKGRAVTQEGPPQLAFEGTLVTERGRYVVNLAGLVKKSFEIEQGELRFYGEPEFNPQLDMRALHTVRLASATYGGRNNVRIRVKIQGTLESPRLSLESADSLQLSQSDMISYLVFGTPSFDVGGGQRQNYSQLSAVLFGTLVNTLSSRFSGGFFDYVEVQTAADRLRLPNSQQASAGGYFAGAQLGFGKQLNDRTFVSLTAGVCQFGQLSPLSNQKVDPASIADAIGTKVEYQIDPSMGLGIAASVEPSLSALLCSQGIDRGFSASVRQLGFDLFRVFHY